MTSGTAWVLHLRGPAGAATAGAGADHRVRHRAVRRWVLIAGAGDSGVEVSFALAAVLVVIAMVVVVMAARRTAAPSALHDAKKSVGRRPFGHAGVGVGHAAAPWVFASATLGFITIPARVHTGLAAPMAVA